MAFFTDLWEGIKNVGSSVLNVLDTIAAALFDTVFWLIDRVFDAIEAIVDFVEWTFEKIGEWLSPTKGEGEVVILPTTPQVVNIVSNLEDQGKVKVGQTVQLRRGKTAMQVLQSDGQVKKVVLAGSEKGFSEDINGAIQNGKLYKIPVKD